MEYTFTQDELNVLVGYVRMWGRDERHCERLTRIDNLSLFESIMSAMRQWDGPGLYRVEGPCDAQVSEVRFLSIVDLITHMGNWSRTMRAVRVPEKEFRRKGSRRDRGK